MPLTSSEIKSLATGLTNEFNLEHVALLRKLALECGNNFTLIFNAIQAELSDRYESFFPFLKDEVSGLMQQIGVPATGENLSSCIPEFKPVYLGIMQKILRDALYAVVNFSDDQEALAFIVLDDKQDRERFMQERARRMQQPWNAKQEAEKYADNMPGMREFISFLQALKGQQRLRVDTQKLSPDV